MVYFKADKKVNPKCSRYKEKKHISVTNEVMDGNQTYCDSHTYVHHILMLQNLSIQSAVCQLYLSKEEGE